MAIKELIEADMYTDGSVRMLAEKAGIGGWIHCHQRPREIWYSFSEEIPYELAINSIEYQAVVFGLKAALDLHVEAINIYTDSSIVVKQVKGEYLVHSATLLVLRNQTMDLLKQFGKWRIRHIPREKNHRADVLAGFATGRADALRRIDHIHPGGKLDELMFGKKTNGESYA